MKQRIYSQDLQEIILANSYPQHQFSEEGITERNFVLDQPFGRAEMNEIMFDGVLISYGTINLTKSTILQTENDFENITMHFCINGNSVSKLGNAKGKFTDFGMNQHNIIYTPFFDGQLELSEEKDIRLLEIVLNKSFFTRLIPEDNLLFKKFYYAIQHQQHAVLSEHNRHISPEMLWVIKQIIHCNRKGYIKKIFLESKVLELLMLQLEQLESEEQLKTITSLRGADLEKIHYAKQLVLENLQRPCSLIELSRQVGLNDFKLKKGFKEVFGTTVFGYINEIRMQQARERLLNSDLNINEIADLIGYKNRTHFTAAFKKTFGELPSKIKRDT